MLPAGSRSLQFCTAALEDGTVRPAIAQTVRNELLSRKIRPVQITSG